MTFKPFLRPIIVVVAIAAVLLYWRHWIHERRALQKAEARALVVKGRAAQAHSAHPNPQPGANVLETAHYAITSTANATQTQQVAEAVEALYAAYAEVFPADRAQVAVRAKLKLTLYAHQAQFKANNRSLPWAEAYYLRPICYAYYAKHESNQSWPHSFEHEPGWISGSPAGFKLPWAKAATGSRPCQASSDQERCAVVVCCRSRCSG